MGDIQRIRKDGSVEERETTLTALIRDLRAGRERPAENFCPGGNGLERHHSGTHASSM